MTCVMAYVMTTAAGELRAPQREACRQAVMALALEAVLSPVLKVDYPSTCRLKL